MGTIETYIARYEKILQPVSLGKNFHDVLIQSDNGVIGHLGFYSDGSERGAVHYRQRNGSFGFVVYSIIFSGTSQEIVDRTKEIFFQRSRPVSFEPDHVRMAEMIIGI